MIKLQTEMYQKISKIKPNNSNIYQCYLELYQKDKLQFYLPFVTKYYYDIIKRINNSMRTLSKEILNIYHVTRKKKIQKFMNYLEIIIKK